MDIRPYKIGEETEIWAVFYDSMRNVCSRDYTSEQIQRWAPDDRDMAEWAIRLKEKKPFVAVEDQQILGFVELENDGHIDFFYCHSKHQGKGVGSLLMANVEERAVTLHLRSIHAEVSKTAMTFFLAKGFEIEEETNKIVCDAPAKQYTMRREIST